ncbi:MAG: 1-acyl-sn-glycerol-3-phosphate acyltransferase [Verrucomicrobia bacterium]|nr:1-acyl-sn-glycerol-3-phosphate acyltransferase [Verrucomicrobiota bacterium]
MGYVNQCWRAIGTGICFVLFGIGGLLLTLLVSPALWLFVRNSLARQLKAQSIIHRIFKLFLVLIRWLGGADIEFVGMEKLKNDHGCLIVANHPSLIDYVMVASCLPQCDCVVKSAIFNNPCMSGIVKAAGYISNDDVGRCVDECIERLQRGHVLLVFPEGTRTTPGKYPTLVRGAAQIATHAKVDLRLVHISVNTSLLDKEHKWYEIPLKRPFFRVEAKSKIAIKPFLREARSANAAARNLNKYLAEVLFPENMKIRQVER